MHRRGGAGPAGRIRDELHRRGPAALADEDLLALLVSACTPRGTCRAVAERLIDRWRGLDGLRAATERELRRTAGIGRAGASRIAAALEIARRIGPGVDMRPVVRTPQEVAREARDLASERREVMVGLYLDAQTRLVQRETIAVGSLNVARASPRDVLEPAIRLLAAGFVLAHNHPSGSAEPSDDDVRFTCAIGRAANLVGVPLYDHVVIGHGGFVSLRARGVRWDGQH
ncbi:MAG: DNA repair protein RadC [Acidobacteriota bacterium]|nr:DNA repair protein RadC [Acidobacteriota bacterium]